MTQATLNGGSADMRISWETFGAFLRRMREQRGLSQDALSKLMGCHRTHVYRLEHGERWPSSIFLRLLSQVFTPSVEELALIQSFEQLREFHCDSFD